ncbi:MAG TPA: iron-sulfur cluster assembly accessory protein [Thermoanaerobaculia bacterium]|nr:iron-sulfur cluster assembly accessory protein [Thermoanaerobaculia bacterium]
MENMEQSQTPASDAQPQEYTPVTMTKKAADMARITREQEGIDASHGLRIAVRGGGCSGFEYALDFEKEPRDNDWVYEQNGLTIYVDAVSAKYLEGTEIDYVLGATGAGFKFNNPQARGTCGCGSSFAV